MHRHAIVAPCPLARARRGRCRGRATAGRRSAESPRRPTMSMPRNCSCVRAGFNPSRAASFCTHGRVSSSSVVACSGMPDAPSTRHTQRSSREVDMRQIDDVAVRQDHRVDDCAATRAAHSRAWRRRPGTRIARWVPRARRSVVSAGAMRATAVVHAGERERAGAGDRVEARLQSEHLIGLGDHLWERREQSLAEGGQDVLVAATNAEADRRSGCAAARAASTSSAARCAVESRRVSRSALQAGRGAVSAGCSRSPPSSRLLPPACDARRPSADCSQAMPSRPSSGCRTRAVRRRRARDRSRSA